MGEQCTCSAWAAFGKASENGHSYLGFHGDADISSAPYQIVVTAKPSKGNSFISIDMAGCIGSWAGMNGKGLATAWTTVGTSDEGGGTSPYILSRLALQYCGGVNEVIDLVNSGPRVFGANLLLTEREGKAVVVEYTHSHFNARVPIDSCLAVPSHFVSNEMNRYCPSMPRYPSSYYRYIRLEQLLYQNKGKMDMKIMEEIDRDHFDLSIGKTNPSPNTICRHNSPDTVSSFLCDVTGIGAHSKRSSL